MVRIWKDHPMYGKRLGFLKDGVRFEADVIDVKPGPMLVDTNTFDQPEATIIGTIKLRIKPVDGHRAAFWTPPMEYKPEPTP